MGIPSELTPPRTPDLRGGPEEAGAEVEVGGDFHLWPLMQPRARVGRQPRKSGGGRGWVARGAPSGFRW